jgi:tripartite-type tricarboxylate transporter receptor subunit TctC
MLIVGRRGLLAVAGLALATGARAQGSQAISLVVGYSAGGSADLVSRIMASELSARLGRSVVVENVAGASGMIAFQRLANNRPDTSTLYFGGFDTVAVPMVNRNVKLDWERDTIPVSRTTIGGMTFVVPASSPYRDMAAFIAAARKDGSEARSYGSPGVASAQHFLGELIGERAGVTLLHSPYRGGNLVVNDLIAGNLDAAVLVDSTAIPPIQQGTLRALAVSSAARVPQLPDVPTLAELPGFEGVAFPLWQGIFVRTGTPDAFVQQLDTAIREALATPAVQKQLSDAGFTASPLGGDEFRAFIRQQADGYRSIVTASKLSVE